MTALSSRADGGGMPADDDAIVDETEAFGVGKATGSGGGCLPRTIGKYPVSRFLGEGGMGEVYLGMHPELNIPVAIKTVAVSSDTPPEHIERFLREGRLAVQLQHPNIVRVYDAGREGDRCYIVQEYIDGGDLTTRVRTTAEGRLPASEALRITTAVARALVAAEELEIVHRDIKPSNILMTPSGEPKLGDFGLAKQLGSTSDTDRTVTQSGIVFGSPGYMAPEQIEDFRRVDIRADIYSLGITLYFMLTGERPFSGESVAEMLAKQLEAQNPLEHDAFRHGVSPRLMHITRRMTARLAEERYGTARELLRDLETLCAQRSRRWWARPRVWSAAAAVLVAGVVGWLQLTANGPRERLDRALQFLASDDVARAEAALVPLATAGSHDGRAAYGLGLCYVARGAFDRLGTVYEHLRGVRDGEELSAHLSAAASLAAGDAATAERLISEWEHRARYPLPFMLTKARLLLSRGDTDGAIACLDQAVSRAGVFDFQRLTAVDFMARLFASRGEHDQAASLYAQALEDGTRRGDVVPHTFQANYAVTLMNSRRPDAAVAPLQVALDLRPDDELAAFLRRELDARNADERERFSRASAMLTAVSERVDTNVPTDPWTSTPLVVVFLPPENRNPMAGRLGQELLWLDELTEQFMASSDLPVVNRSHLDYILREKRLSLSDLASPEARGRLRTLLPGSILVRSTFNFDAEEPLRLVPISVETGEVLGSIHPAAAGQRHVMVTAAADALHNLLMTQLPPHGFVSHVQNGRATVNIGQYHGLRAGAVVLFHAKAERPSAQALAGRQPRGRGRVAAVDRFTADVSVSDGVAEEGMIVVTAAAP